MPRWWDGELVGECLVVVCILQGVGVADDEDVGVEGRGSIVFLARVCRERVEIVGDLVDGIRGGGWVEGFHVGWEGEVVRGRWSIKGEGEELALYGRQ